MVTETSGLEQASGCKKLTALAVGGTSLTHLTGLEDLEGITEGLTLENNPQLHDAAALLALRSIGGSVSIQGNDALGELRLTNLSEVGGDFIDVTYNPSLTRLDLPELVELNSLGVVGNQRLTELQMPRLREVHAVLSLGQGNALSDFSGLGALERIGGNLSVQSDPVLESFDGLDSLREIASDLLVVDNSMLQRLALPALSSVGAAGPQNPDLPAPSGAQIYVFGNPSLTSVALPALTMVGAFRFYENSALPQCELQAIADRLGKPCQCEQNSATCPE